MPLRLNVEPAHIILLVEQCYLLYFSVFSCQITEHPFASMKVDSDIYCHGCLLLQTQTFSTLSLTTLGRSACFITSGSAFFNLFGSAKVVASRRARFRGGFLCT